MSWKDLKRFWFEPAETNMKIADAYAKTNINTSGRAGFSLTEATAIAYATIESAITRPNRANTFHLIIGSYNLWLPYFINEVLTSFGFDRQIIIVLVPPFTAFEIRREITAHKLADKIQLMIARAAEGMGFLRGRNLASVLIYMYEYTFNWEAYDLDLALDAYIIFCHVRRPVVKFYNKITGVSHPEIGWYLRGKYSSLFFVRRIEVS